MPIIILIPLVVVLFALFRDSVQKTFLDFVIPAWLLLPIYFYWKVAALPPLDFSEAALLPIGILIVFKEMKSWRLSVMDLWLAIFTFSSCYSDSLAGHHTAWIFDLFHTLCEAVIPYMIGKVLIEQHQSRVATVRRMLLVLFGACLFSWYEYRMEQNPFSMIFARFFPGEHTQWRTQIRWGFGRVAGPFGQSELAGIMLVFGLTLALWMAWQHLWEPRFQHLRWLKMQKATLITIVMALTLFMTQARGPWLGAAVALPVLWISRARNVLRASVIVGLLLVVVGGAGSYALKKYAASGEPQSNEQQTAQYRSQLLDNYLPVAEAGGPWGWGQDFPRAPGQGSIDNEYLFLGLTQGWIGSLSFALIGVSAALRAARAAAMAPTPFDQSFALCLLGIVLGVMTVIFTVFLGNQTYALFFLLAGWAQALPVRDRLVLPKPLPAPVYS